MKLLNLNDPGNRATPMHFAIFGSGAVGGYIGAQLARARHQVTFIARGGHLRALQQRGMAIWSSLGDFEVRATADEDPRRVGVVDVIVFTVKTYDNDSAIPSLLPLVGSQTSVLTLQNGVDSPDQLATAVGPEHVIAGSIYIATELSAPGLIRQTGTHRRIVMGEVFGARSDVSARVAELQRMMASADLEVEAVADARVPLWEKLIYLSPFAGFTGAARLPIGPLWGDPDIRALFLEACHEAAAVAAAEGVALHADTLERITSYTSFIPGETRSSLLIDLQAGKPLEVEALQGAIVRRGDRLGVATPIHDSLYAVLKPHCHGTRVRLDRQG